MAINPFALPVRRPTATSMLYVALAVLGAFAWYRIPIELLPALSGEQLAVQFGRRGSEPEVVEREILLPLVARVGELAGLKETWGEVNGANGRLTLEFERGTNHRVRELELRSIAAELQRTQPEGTFINVSSSDLGAFSRFAMTIQVTGGDDQNALRDFVEERVEPRVAAIPGVSQVLPTGGAPREVTIWIDPDRCAAFGIRPELVTRILGQAVRRLRYLGGSEQDGRRWQVVLDGRPGGLASLGEIRLDPTRPVLLRHVADIEMGVARAERAFRIDGREATGLIVFQEEGANLVRLGRTLRERIDDLREEFQPYGIDLTVGFDAAETIEDQLDRLRSLALWGFLIALVVLFLFLRDLRAVAVVAVAVPVSLLVAGAMLYLGGYTLNLITMLGLVVGIGMLVDNSVVVFEAVQRGLERGLKPDIAAISGIRRTMRAIVAASATNAVVFLPAIFIVEDGMVRGALELVAVAILFPLFASLLVALGLVPLLAERLAAPAALARLDRDAQRRREYGGALPPNRVRAVLTALLKSSLRRPTPWIVGVTVAILLTVVVALPWVLVSSLSRQAEQAEQVAVQVELGGSSSLEAAEDVFARIEQAVLDLDGIERVESSFQEIGGTVTVHLDPDARDGATPARVREEVRLATRGLPSVEVSNANLAAGEGGGEDGGGGGGGGGFGGLLGGASAQIRVSGPDMAVIHRLASEIQDRLAEIPDIEDVTISGRSGQDELRIEPLAAALAAYRLNPEEVLNALNVVRREGVPMQVGFTLADGRELPLTVRRPELPEFQVLRSIESLTIATDAGALPLGELTTGIRMPAAPMIAHHNGRRELSIGYTFAADAPETGPDRLRLDEAVDEIVRSAYRPPGYTIEAADIQESTDWFRVLVIPILLLLYAVLAITFESLTMPLLVLISVPLTILGATWALVLAGVGAGVYALVGVIALLGLTVNPAILLVDRMQRRSLDARASGGSAAIAAVRERTRPVLMTSCTTIAGLWPLALSTGDEFEIWPPFATVVMGGLATSTLLTLLVIPVGYVLFARLDRIFGRLGPWILMGWALATAAVIGPLVLTEQLTSMTWQIVTTLLVAGAFLWLALALFRREPVLEFDSSGVAIEARYLKKVYGLPGPIKKAWRLGNEFAAHRRFRTRRDSSERALAFTLLLVGGLYLAINLDGMVWRILFFYLSTAFAVRALIEWRNAVRPFDSSRPPAAIERRAALDAVLLVAGPWIMLAALSVSLTLLPRLADERPTMPVAGIVVLAVLTLLVQLGRHTARGAAATRGSDRDAGGLVARVRGAWRQLCLAVFGLDLPREEVEALATTSFAAKQGMIGILGPNGAGKTTLLRLLAAVLDPTAGAVHYGGRLKRRVGGYVSRWVGYLPQEFGLPDHLTAQEYLDYFALLYEVGNARERRERVDTLLAEVGLGERKHERIGGYSGGMRQRVAVARTLLRQPPIIIVDEPTVGLDPRERIRFRNLLAKLAEGRVVLFSTHVVEDVAVSCQRVVVMRKGRMVYDGKPDELAAMAEGKIWEIRLAAGEQPELPKESKVVDQVPEAGEGVRLRVLCASQPHPNARSIAPVIEDGYLKLVNWGVD
jgi:multidrug efflux pump subunit AcrB/ABC-type multidrug transport system ATPase subunit